MFITSFLIGYAIGYAIGYVISEICLYIDGWITERRIREEASKKAELNAVHRFLVTQVEHTSRGPKIHIDGKTSSGDVVAHITVEGGSYTTLSSYDSFSR